MAMSSAEIFTKVTELIAQIVQVPLAHITPSSTLESLGADSIDMFEMVMKVEETFSIELSDQDAQQIKTVQDLVDAIIKAHDT